MAVLQWAQNESVRVSFACCFPSALAVGAMRLLCSIMRFGFLLLLLVFAQPGVLSNFKGTLPLFLIIFLFEHKPSKAFHITCSLPLLYTSSTGKASKVDAACRVCITTIQVNHCAAGLLHRINSKGCSTIVSGCDRKLCRPACSAVRAAISSAAGWFLELF